MDLTRFDFSKIQHLLRENSISCSLLLEKYLQNINEGKEINAFISICSEEARASAEKIDRKIKDGTAGRLAGLILAVKDNILVRGSETTCGSRILSNFVAPYNATVIEKVLQEDAIIIGKTNMDEFAMGSSNESSYFGVTRNPFDLSRVPGGSSGGSAAAVASFQATAALGSDTGGSIRQPAAFCGLVGLKPTYGAVSRYGLIAYACSFDQIGPIAHTVADCEKIFDVIKGKDPLDSTSRDYHFESSKKPIDQIIVGVPGDEFFENIQDEIKQSWMETIDKLERKGAKITQIGLPHERYAIAAYYIIAAAEASSNLARYDGVRYGLRIGKTEELFKFLVKNRSMGFGEEVKRRIVLGTFVLSHGYYDRYYRKAQVARKIIKKDFERAFEKCDVILTPTTPTTAFEIGEKKGDSLAMYLCDVFTVAANLTGLPALNVPAGKDGNGLPIGMQLMGREFSEPLLFSLGKSIENSQSS